MEINILHIRINTMPDAMMSWDLKEEKNVEQYKAEDTLEIYGPYMVVNTVDDW